MHLANVSPSKRSTNPSIYAHALQYFRAPSISISRKYRTCSPLNCALVYFERIDLSESRVKRNTFSSRLGNCTKSSLNGLRTEPLSSHSSHNEGTAMKFAPQRDDRSFSNRFLKRVFLHYEEANGVSIDDTIKQSSNVDLVRVLLITGSLPLALTTFHLRFPFSVQIVRNPARFFAEELRKSMQGSNVDEEMLNRILVHRCEIDMVQIKSEYEKLAKRTLYDHIQVICTIDDEFN
jgi:hypothetical protein